MEMMPANAAGWPTRMSKPLPRLKASAHVIGMFSTPGFAGASHRKAERRGVVYKNHIAVGCDLAGTGRVKVDFDALGRDAFGAVSESEPLPPVDCVSPRRHVPLEILYRDQAPRLLRLFERKATRQDAQDLTQDTFLKLIAAQDHGDAVIERPEAYLTQVTKNALRNRARAAFHRSTVTNANGVDDLPATTDPTSMLEARDMLNRLEHAMRRLSPKSREIFMAHRLHGATYAEIAADTGLSVRGVEWHMSKAIACLHRALGPRR